MGNGRKRISVEKLSVVRENAILRTWGWLDLKSTFGKLILLKLEIGFRDEDRQEEQTGAMV